MELTVASRNSDLRPSVRFQRSDHGLDLHVASQFATLKARVLRARCGAIRNHAIASMFGRITLAGIWIGFGSLADSRVGTNCFRNKMLQEAFSRLWSASNVDDPGFGCPRSK